MRTVYSHDRESAISEEFMHENQKTTPLVDRTQKNSQVHNKNHQNWSLYEQERDI